MTQSVIATRALTKRYGDVVAVRDLDLEVERGRIFGLLGPNGAGKTTIIGCLLGLIVPDGGRIELFGADGGVSDEAVRRIGAIMETPAFYPYLSGRDNLRYFQGISGHADAAEIDGLLEKVGLAHRADARFITYSLGMKHRLGIAFALLGDPELLLLDEPTNGLDPAGMAEVRELIRSLGDGKRTVLLASHLLNEVQQVCDRVAILSNGRVVADGAVEDLIHGQNRIRLGTTDDAAAARVLAALDWVESVSARDGGLSVVADPQRTWELTAALAGDGVYVAEMRIEETSLEQYFLSVVEEQRE
jgi:ABC-type multidrug transport system ATPase subunit